jgi:hypothetical protein
LVKTARIRLLVLAAACAAGPVRAQDEVTVVSPAADSTAVTIYRDNLALITETRTVNLPASAVTLVLDGVVETLLPQSAVLTDAGRAPAESDFSFNRLTPKSLLEHSIGETVTLTRTNPVTGRVTRTSATILAAGEGVVLQIAGGNEALYCSGLPERLEFRRIPGELLAKPQLAIKLAAGEAGARTVKVSYLAHGFAWSSDYVAHLNERSDRMQLEGWATLTNLTGTAFEQAEVQVVAGKLNILGAGERGSAAEPVYANEGESDVDARDRIMRAEAESEVALLRDCFAADLPLTDRLLRRLDGPQVMYAAAMNRVALEEIAVTGSRIAAREELGDYQLYRLPWRTDLGARQTKQVLFLDKPAVRVERFYGFRLATLTDAPDEDVVSPNLIVRWDNTERAGLGEPLPSGIVRVFEPYGGRELFAGEAELGDRPVGLPVELTIGRALNVSLEVTTGWEREGALREQNERTIVMAEHRIANNKSVPVELEIRHAVESSFANVKVDESSKPMRKKYGDLAWRFKVPPGSEQVLTYRLSAIELDY